eukprot:CAMPEP_0169123982 /NCGR_PEP_ID=MMETSP1015-20121227/34076_1 /TAXON_ID=342587 /ORGANISM="Karlodinium micrum, Strain CCMP2283" /LENGTH=157 /DNA_ID=CAMNT_0009187357 /DNA_START=48 /DNA_END=521 /DNA_ORIENTATION=+
MAQDEATVAAAIAKFTPAEINREVCMARIWAGGAGGQCTKAKEEGCEFCRLHKAEGKWKVHGRVDGDIPAKKLAEFVSWSQKPKKPELTDEEKAAKKAKLEEKKAAKKEDEEKRNAKKEELAKAKAEEKKASAPSVKRKPAAAPEPAPKIAKKPAMK